MIYNYAGIKKKCDVLVSTLVRKQGLCDRCGSTKNLQAAHIISRTYMATRFDLENLLCLCAGCHLYWWHKEPIEAARWLEEKYPGRYDRLNVKRQAISKIDIQGMYLYLKQLSLRAEVGSEGTKDDH